MNSPQRVGKWEKNERMNKLRIFAATQRCSSWVYHGFSLRSSDFDVFPHCSWFRNPARKPPGMYCKWWDKRINYQPQLVFSGFLKHQQLSSGLVSPNLAPCFLLKRSTRGGGKCPHGRQAGPSDEWGRYPRGGSEKTVRFGHLRWRNSSFLEMFF